MYSGSIKSGIEKIRVALFVKGNFKAHVITYTLLSSAFLYVSDNDPSIGFWKTGGLYLCGLLFWLMKSALEQWDIKRVLASKAREKLFTIRHSSNGSNYHLLPIVPGMITATLVMMACYLVMKEMCFAYVSGLLMGYLLYSTIRMRNASRRAATDSKATEERKRHVMYTSPVKKNYKKLMDQLMETDLGLKTMVAKELYRLN